MIRPFPRHGSQVILGTPIFEVRVDDAEHPSTGRRGAYYVLQTPAYVNVVALTTDRRLVLVRQWRHGVREIGLEIPAGLVEPGESPLDAAVRELREETGYVAGRLSLLGSVQPNVLLRNVGGRFVPDGGVSGLDLEMAGGGLGVGDVNEDGVPDFLIPQWNDLSLMLSAEDGRWYDWAPTLGMMPRDEQSVGWGAELADVELEMSQVREQRRFD